LLALSPLLFRPSPEDSIHSGTKAKPTAMPIGTLLRVGRGRVAILVVVGLLRIMPAAGSTIALAFLLKQRGLGNDAIGVVQSVFLLGIGLGGLLCAAVVHQGLERRVLWSLPMISVPFMLACPWLGWGLMIGCVGLLGGLIGLGLPVFISYGQQLLPEGQRLASSLTMGVIWGLGGAIVAGIMAVCDRIDRPDLAFPIFATSLLLAGLAGLNLPETGRRFERPNQR